MATTALTRHLPTASDMIHPFDNENSTRWGRGDFRVQIERAGHTRPMGYCDGTEEDERELRTLAESEGVEDLLIHKKRLKSGREIWTLGEVPTGADEAIE